MFHILCCNPFSRVAFSLHDCIFLTLHSEPLPHLALLRVGCSERVHILQQWKDSWRDTRYRRAGNVSAEIGKVSGEGGDNVSSTTTTPSAPRPSVPPASPCRRSPSPPPPATYVI